MNLLHLKYAIEIEKAGSITQAAKNLFMGQPNLSKAIKDLEQEIGITIFKRTVKGAETTDQGAEFLSYAKTILSQIDELESLYKPRTSNQIELNISVPRATYISAIFTDFLNQLNPEQQMDIRFKETAAVTTISDVSFHQADLGLIRYQAIYENYFINLLKEHNLEHEMLREFRMCIMMSKDNPLAEFDIVPYHMLNGYTEILQGDFLEPPVPVSHIKKESSSSGISKRLYIYDRGSQMDFLREIKNSFMWVSPVPENLLKQYQLVLRECIPAGSLTKDVIIYHKKQRLSSYGAQLIDFFHNSEKHF